MTQVEQKTHNDFFNVFSQELETLLSNHQKMSQMYSNLDNIKNHMTSQQNYALAKQSELSIKLAKDDFDNKEIKEKDSLHSFYKLGEINAFSILFHSLEKHI